MLLYLSHLILVFFNFPLLLVSISRITKMTSSDSRNTSRTPSEGTSLPYTPLGNVYISTCSSGLRYRLYLVEVVFPLLDGLWVSDEHIPLKTIMVVFTKRVELEGFEGQPTTCGRTMTDIVLAGLQEKHSIPDEYVLLCPGQM